MEPRCTSCRAILRPDEDGRQGCLSCLHTASQHLKRLSGPAGLYRALRDALTPSRGEAGPRVSGGSVTPRLGCDVRVLDLTSTVTGITATLEDWVTDWYTLMGQAVPAPAGGGQERVDAAAGHLRFHLEWAADQHPAWRDFARELTECVIQCEDIALEGLQRRPVVGTCPTVLRDKTVCGGELRYDKATVTTRCLGCKCTAPVDWRAIRRAVNVA